ncbi:MAG: type II secretion system protein M [Candidatus Thiodiazotropha sp.]|jgi:general secretion pathway protein M
MKQWWSSKSPQEHLAIIIGSLAVLVLLFYLAIWRPFSQNLEKKVVLVKSQESTLQWMQENSNLIKRMQARQGSKRGKTNEALLTLVDRTAKSIRLREQIQRIKPQGDNKVQLWVEEASFDLLIRWLGQLTQDYALEIESLNIDRQDAPGLVNARLVLQRGGKS